ncbi:MAG: T9SS type A sorting domain-containing protein [Bacteroidetes bacterium]|nr:T9SS type A sorting domain-containing protein [Bacteroidota bacterium]
MKTRIVFLLIALPLLFSNVVAQSQLQTNNFPIGGFVFGLDLQPNSYMTPAETQERDVLRTSKLVNKYLLAGFNTNYFIDGSEWGSSTHIDLAHQMQFRRPFTNTSQYNNTLHYYEGLKDSWFQTYLGGKGINPCVEQRYFVSTYLTLGAEFDPYNQIKTPSEYDFETFERLLTKAGNGDEAQTSYKWYETVVDNNGTPQRKLVDHRMGMRQLNGEWWIRRSDVQSGTDAITFKEWPTYIGDPVPDQPLGYYWPRHVSGPDQKLSKKNPTNKDEAGYPFQIQPTQAQINQQLSHESAGLPDEWEFITDVNGHKVIADHQFSNDSLRMYFIYRLDENEYFDDDDRTEAPLKDNLYGNIPLYTIKVELTYIKKLNTFPVSYQTLSQQPSWNVSRTFDLTWDDYRYFHQDNNSPSNTHLTSFAGRQYAMFPCPFQTPEHEHPQPYMEIPLTHTDGDDLYVANSIQVHLISKGHVGIYPRGFILRSKIADEIVTGYLDNILSKLVQNTVANTSDPDTHLPPPSLAALTTAGESIWPSYRALAYIDNMFNNQPTVDGKKFGRHLLSFQSSPVGANYHFLRSIFYDQNGASYPAPVIVQEIFDMYQKGLVDKVGNDIRPLFPSDGLSAQMRHFQGTSPSLSFLDLGFGVAGWSNWPHLTDWRSDIGLLTSTTDANALPAFKQSEYSKYVDTMHAHLMTSDRDHAEASHAAYTVKQNLAADATSGTWYSLLSTIGGVRLPRPDAFTLSTVYSALTSFTGTPSQNAQNYIDNIWNPLFEYQQQFRLFHDPNHPPQYPGPFRFDQLYPASVFDLYNPKWGGSDKFVFSARSPISTEIRAEGWNALCWGAKGIFFNTLGSDGIEQMGICDNHMNTDFDGWEYQDDHGQLKKARFVDTYPTAQVCNANTDPNTNDILNTYLLPRQPTNVSKRISYPYRPIHFADDPSADHICDNPTTVLATSDGMLLSPIQWIPSSVPEDKITDYMNKQFTVGSTDVQLMLKSKGTSNGDEQMFHIVAEDGSLIRTDSRNPNTNDTWGGHWKPLYEFTSETHACQGIPLCSSSTVPGHKEWLATFFGNVLKDPSNPNDIEYHDPDGWFDLLTWKPHDVTDAGTQTLTIQPIRHTNDDAPSIDAWIPTYYGYKQKWAGATQLTKDINAISTYLTRFQWQRAFTASDLGSFDELDSKLNQEPKFPIKSIRTNPVLPYAYNIEFTSPQHTSFEYHFVKDDQAPFDDIKKTHLQLALFKDPVIRDPFSFSFILANQRTWPIQFKPNTDPDHDGIWRDFILTQDNTDYPNTETLLGAVDARICSFTINPDAYTNVSPAFRHGDKGISMRLLNLGTKKHTDFFSNIDASTLTTVPVEFAPGQGNLFRLYPVFSFMTTGRGTSAIAYNNAGHLSSSENNTQQPSITYATEDRNGIAVSYPQKDTTDPNIHKMLQLADSQIVVIDSSGLSHTPAVCVYPGGPGVGLVYTLDNAGPSKDSTYVIFRYGPGASPLNYPVSDTLDRYKTFSELKAAPAIVPSKSQGLSFWVSWRHPTMGAKIAIVNSLGQIVAQNSFWAANKFETKFISLASHMQQIDSGVVGIPVDTCYIAFEEGQGISSDIYFVKAFHSDNVNPTQIGTVGMKNISNGMPYCEHHFPCISVTQKRHVYVVWESTPPAVMHDNLDSGLFRRHYTVLRDRPVQGKWSQFTSFFGFESNFYPIPLLDTLSVSPVITAADPIPGPPQAVEGSNSIWQDEVRMAWNSPIDNTIRLAHFGNYGLNTIPKWQIVPMPETSLEPAMAPRTRFNGVLQPLLFRDDLLMDDSNSYAVHLTQYSFPLNNIVDTVKRFQTLIVKPIFCACPSVFVAKTTSVDIRRYLGFSALTLDWHGWDWEDTIRDGNGGLSAGGYRSDGTVFMPFDTLNFSALFRVGSFHQGDTMYAMPCVQSVADTLGFRLVVRKKSTNDLVWTLDSAEYAMGQFHSSVPYSKSEKRTQVVPPVFTNDSVYLSLESYTIGHGFNQAAPNDNLDISHQLVYDTTIFDIPAPLDSTQTSYKKEVPSTKPSLVSIVPMSIDIYPNPYRDFTTVNIFAPLNTSMKVAIFDVLGRVIQTLFDGANDKPMQSFQVGNSGLDDGLYFIRAQAGSQVVTKKLELRR